MDFSSFISDTEVALHEYAYSPQIGLEKYQSTLSSFRKITHLNACHDVFQSRLTLLIDAVDRLLLSGSPYFTHYHTAFLSATDALFQVAIGSQFGVERSLQLSPLLSIERPCWSILLSRSVGVTTAPTYVDYHAYLNIEASALDVGEYLASLGMLGRVSFHLDSSSASLLSGYFVLSSVQPITWLETRFSSLQWRIAEKKDNTSESLRGLLELSFAAFFQHNSMSRDCRYRLLGMFERQFTASFYKEFGSLFSPDVENVKQTSRFVPVVKDEGGFQMKNNRSGERDRFLSHFPIRHGGRFYSAVMNSHENSANVFYRRYLGRDCLSSFLYEIETNNGRFVFDRAECFGFYSIGMEDVSRGESKAYFIFEGHLQAQIVFVGSAYHSIEELFSLSPESFVNVLIVEQAGEYFALPYVAIREIECVCALMSSSRFLVKNIWLDKDNEPYLEPWLISSHRLSYGYSERENKTCNHISKSGYYSGKVYGKLFCIEAELLSALVPYQAPFSFSNLDGERSEPFILYDGECFDKVVAMDFNDSLLSSEERHVFSVILEWAEEAIVLPFDSCEWRASLSEVSYIKEFDVVPGLTSTSGREHFISSLQDDVIVIDKANFLSFVGGLWPSSLSLESEY
jgi:hypothetical protein